MNTFSAEMLLSENYHTPTTIPSVYVEHDLFNESLDFIMSITNEMNTYRKDLHKSILEADGNQYIIQESFDGFIGKIKKIIDKFLDFIKKIFKKFSLMLHKIVKSDKYIVKHKEDVKKFSGEFDIKGYKYTNLDNDDFPQINAYQQFSTFNKYKPSEQIKTADDLIDATSNLLSSAKSDIDDWYSSFRGTVLGSDGSYSETEFKEELFKKFRNQEDSADTITIDSVGVIDSLDRFLNYDKTINHIKKLQSNLEKEYKNIKSEAKDMASSFDQNDYTKDIFGNGTATIYAGSDTENKTKIDSNVQLIMDLIVDRITKMCTIHSMAFTSKLEAAKQCYIQDKKILYRALKTVVKEEYSDEDANTIAESVDTLGSSEYIKVDLSDNEGGY